jgi:hypothetical protein
MKQESVFDHLVRTLSSDERQAMLDRIRAQEPVPIELVSMEDDSHHYDVLETYHNFGLFMRIYCFFRALITGTDKLEIVEELAITNLARTIEHEVPSLLHYNDGEIGTGFYQKISELNEELAVLRQPLRRALGSEKSDFVAFYLGWSMPVLQERLMELMNPRKVAFERSLDNPLEVKRTVEMLLDELLEEIYDQDRKRLFRQAKALTILLKLTDFPFHKLTGPFMYNKSAPVPVGMNEIRAPLFELNAILYSLNPLPEEDTLKALFMFDMDKDLDEHEFNPAEKLARMMESLARVYRCISQTITGLQLNDLCRVISRNLNYQPEATGGGEDWFLLYKRFWQQRCSKALTRYMEEHKREHLAEESAAFLRKKKLPEFDYYRNEALPEGIFPKYANSLIFIRTFVIELFLQELHSPLKLVLIDGQFYKDQNRSEYNDSYSGILKAVDDIANLDASLSPEGAVRTELEKIEKEMLGSKLLRRKLESKMKELDQDAERVINTFLENMRLLTSVLGGIVDGVMGGRYDSLSNLGYIGKNDNKNLLKRLRLVRTVLDKAAGLARELYEVERNIDGAA